jgi:hypothetical protein
MANENVRCTVPVPNAGRCRRECIYSPSARRKGSRCCLELERSAPAHQGDSLERTPSGLLPRPSLEASRAAAAAGPA